MEKHLRFNHFTGKRLHLGVCGSVAAFRVAELVHRWQEAGVSLSATLTSAARKFIGPLTFEALALPRCTEICSAGNLRSSILSPGRRPMP